MGRLHAVLLAGTIRPSPLREVMDIPALCLPVGAEGTLLDAWHRVLGAVDAAADVRVVVNSQSDVETVAAAAESSPRVAAGPGTMGIIAEPAAWRGTAGVLRDVTDDLDPNDLVLVAEGTCLPPATLRPLRSAMGRGVLGVVGVCGEDTPAGVFLFRRAALETVAPVGYYDVKEQLLPALHASGLRVGIAPLGARVHRIRDRRRYLEAVAAVVGESAPGRAARWIAPDATVAPSAVLDGFGLVGAGATIGADAVVHESVVLDGATVEPGAVLSRSILGPGARLESGRRLVRSVESVGVPARAGAVGASSRPERRGAA